MSYPNQDDENNISQEKDNQLKAQKETMLKQVLSTDARLRLNNVRMVKPDLADLVENYILNLTVQGKITGQISDEQLKQILSSMKNSKLVVISQSVPTKTAEKIEESAQNDNVPLIHFNDTSVILGKLCGLQFRVSAISLSSLSNSNVQAILKEYETK